MLRKGKSHVAKENQEDDEEEAVKGNQEVGDFRFISITIFLLLFFFQLLYFIIFFLYSFYPRHLLTPTPTPTPTPTTHDLYPLPTTNDI